MKTGTIIFVVTLLATSVFITGCTIPYYQRTITRSYDASGNLTGTVVTENVQQQDPNIKPLLNVLKTQTYTK